MACVLHTMYCVLSLSMACVVLQRAVDTRMCLANLEKMPASEKLALLMKDVGYSFIVEVL